MPDTVMLFAAGRGTRMAPLTDDMAKPMIPVAGRPLIDHAMDLVSSAGLSRVFANTHYKPEPLEAHLAKLGVTALRETRLLDTGGGLKQALPQIDRDTVITLNTDAVWEGYNPLPSLLSLWNPERMDALLCLIRPSHVYGHMGSGDFIQDPTGRLQRGPGHVYSGLQIIKTDRLAEIPQEVFSLNLLWDRFIPDKRLFGMVHSGRWCDVGRPESIALAEDLVRV